MKSGHCEFNFVWTREALSWSCPHNERSLLCNIVILKFFKMTLRLVDEILSTFGRLSSVGGRLFVFCCSQVQVDEMSDDFFNIEELTRVHSRWLSFIIFLEAKIVQDQGMLKHQVPVSFPIMVLNDMLVYRLGTIEVIIFIFWGLQMDKLNKYQNMIKLSPHALQSLTLSQN